MEGKKPINQEEIAKEMWKEEAGNSFSAFDGETEGEFPQEGKETEGFGMDLVKDKPGKNVVLSPKKKKKRKKKVVVFLLLAVVIGVSAFAIVKKRQSDAVAGKKTEPISDTVKTGDIGTTVSGTGTLAYEDAEDIKILDGIMIEKVYVEAGDAVKKGDTLALVNKTSVLTVMADLQGEIDSLDEKIEDTEDDTDSSTVTAGVSGRVKKIYASSGDKVTSLMESKGALLLLSIDGKMAVDLEDVSGLSVGDSVDVTLSDGDTVTGTVASVEGSGATITVTDKGTAYQDLVSVSNSSGKVIGSGNLYIHSALKVTGYSGTVSSVKVSENEWVDAGDSLIKLKSLGHTAEYEQYVSQRQELSDALAEATVLYESGVITADFEGTMQSVSVSDGTTVGEDTSSSSASSSTTSTGTSSANASGVSYSSGSSTTVLASRLVAGENQASVTELSSGTLAEGRMTALLSESASAEEGATEAAGESTTASGATTQTSTQTESTTAAESTTQTESTTAAESATQITTADDTEATTSESTTASESTKSDSSTQTESKKQTTEGTNAAKGTASGGGISGAGSSGGSITTTTGDSSSETEESSLVEETVVFTESSNEKMAVTVSVDELDILSLEEGQEAEVTIDAVGTDVFTGTVSEISTVASSTDGGNTKYTATVLMDKTEDMLVGMNASIVITISKAADVLLVPASAVNEEGDSVYVYTQYDSKSGELSGKTEVTTGVSDGNNTEIQSGLSEGDTIYYTQRSTADSEEEAESGFPNGMGGDGNWGNMKNGGERPSGGGGMPSGNGSGTGN